MAKKFIFRSTEEFCNFLDKKNIFSEINKHDTVINHLSIYGLPIFARLLSKKIKDKNIVFVFSENDQKKELFFQSVNDFCDVNAYRYFSFNSEDIENNLVDPESSAQSLEFLSSISKNTNRNIYIINSIDLSHEVSSKKEIKKNTLQLSLGNVIEISEFLEKLNKNGFSKTDYISRRGQYAQRGGILDVFSWQWQNPIRIEFFDTEIESLREFDINSQLSLKKIDSLQLLLNFEEINSNKTKLADYFSYEKDIFIYYNPSKKEDAVMVFENEPEDFIENKKIHDFICEPSPLGEFKSGDFILQESKKELFLDQIKKWNDAKWDIFMFFNREAEAKRFLEIFPEKQLSKIKFIRGDLSKSLAMPSIKTAVLSDSELFGRYRTKKNFRTQNRLLISQENEIVWKNHLKNFHIGDLVVHQDYGIGIYKGFTSDEELEIEYANKSRLLLPMQKVSLVSKYVGLGDKKSKLSTLGDNKWTRQKQKTEKSIFEYASTMLKTQAERKVANGLAHKADNQWVKQFEDSFIYKETKDQLTAINETKQDMESEKAMDRLICGDVGFGKTEVAIRASFKAVMGEWQVAIIAPTTVLSAQHEKTFRERMSDYPIKIALLNRYKSQSEQKETVKKIANGEVDIVIGTHRVISNDVIFKKLGLVVIDEEQRFGVKHKEKLKEKFRNIDILTLSATPIPRTLYLALMGVKNMSTINTAPPNRFPIKTVISQTSDDTIKNAINNELKRGGQVYFLHNRVKTINSIKKKICELCPNAKVGIGHGQMQKNELENIMRDFIAEKINVLVATTIIESGIDIPNANTIIIDRADMFGLADLYQLRGRVGRANRQAYAFLLMPRGIFSTADARKRLNAIKQYSSLGDGLKIAMQDLEIRGAGNLLGTQQSGNIVNIGFDLYCQMLNKAIVQIKSKNKKLLSETIIHLDFICLSEISYRKKYYILPAFIPSSYVVKKSDRLNCYQAINIIDSTSALYKLKKQWTDIYGKIPPEVDNLIEYRNLKIFCKQRKIQSLEVKQNKLIIKKNNSQIQVNNKYPRLRSQKPHEKLNEIIHKYIKNL